MDRTDPTPRSGRDTGWSTGMAGLTAGIAILLMALLAGFGNLAVLTLVTAGNAAQTAQDVAASDVLFRFGVLSLLLVVALDVVAAWALYRVFSPVSRSISVLAACFRLVYSGVLLVAVSRLPGVLRLLGDDPYLSVFSTEQLQAQALLEIGAFNDVWSAGLGLFGLHLLVIGYLGYRSRYVPRLLGILLAIAGLGYVVDSIGAVLFSGSWTDVSTVTFIGEFLLALWLVIRGRRLRVPESGLNTDPTAVDAR